jgi:hypothetical protein
MKRPIILIISLAGLLLGACSGEQSIEPTPDTAFRTEVESTPQVTETAVLLPTEASTSQPSPPTEAPTPAVIDETPTGEATAEPSVVIDPTATIEPTIEVEETAVQVISGQTAEGAYFYGNPAAPVTLLDYSDFM